MIMMRKFAVARPSALHGTACRCGMPKKIWQLACASCWVRLPKQLRDQVWKLYRDKTARGGPEHTAAVRACVEWWRANPI
jgi:hypothetical protein